MEENVVAAIDPTPRRPNRQAWKEKAAAGKGRTGTPIPRPATEDEVKKNLEVLVVEAVEKVVKKKAVMSAADERTALTMSSKTRAAVLAVLGEDIEQARAYFADRMLAVAHKIVDRIERDIEELPPSSLGFNAAVMIDKSEALRAKHSSSSAGAAVGHQVNVFMSGAEDREKIIAQLTGKAFQPQPAEPVKVEPVP